MQSTPKRSTTKRNATMQSTPKRSTTKQSAIKVPMVRSAARAEPL